MAAGIVLLGATGSVPFLSLTVVSVVFAAVAAVLNVKPWRQQFISAISVAFSQEDGYKCCSITLREGVRAGDTFIVV